ncbi:MAG TPA: glycosyltransferase family 2 protein [Candidatus Woesebacteria bacterium]|nr:glycosyltransferase family 2 protein [Candidatus Woesebacteria bacterium]
MKKISVVIISRNEEAHIEECLTSVRWADEIVVVDDSSTDNTQGLAKKYTDRVFTHKSIGYVEPVRNYALQKATGDWIFLLDTDERVPESLAAAVRNITEQDHPAEAYKIPRKNIIFDKWIQHTGWWPDNNIRFFKKGSVEWSDRIHSVPKVNGAISELDATEQHAIVHYNYTSVSQFIEKMVRYTAVEAQQYSDKVITSDFISKPAQEFLRRFFTAQGYKDGVHGLVLSLLQAVSVFLVLVRVWEIQKFEPKEDKNLLVTVQKQGKTIRKEIAYWMANELLKTERSKLKKVRLKISRKRNNK